MYTSCPTWLRDAYRRSVQFTCELCNKKEEEIGRLHIHRIRRGNKGGDYRPSNCKVICNNCHKKIHSQELGIARNYLF
jgi:5-methylcytosine-specific restriction endonuclease McrA